MSLPKPNPSIKKVVVRIGEKIKKTKGFTLVELLTVITILGILVAFTTVSFVNAQQKGRDGKRKTDLKSIKAALSIYFDENGYYPPSQSEDTNSWNAGGNAGYPSNSGNVPWIPGLTSKYLKVLPKDPLQANSSNILNAFNFLAKLSPLTSVYAGGGGSGGGCCYTPPPARVDLYYYEVIEDRSSYILWASLENTRDAELRTNPNATCQQSPPTSYNYCLIPE